METCGSGVLDAFLCKVKGNGVPANIKPFNASNLESSIIVGVVFAIDYSEGFLLSALKLVTLINGQGAMEAGNGIL